MEIDCYLKVIAVCMPLQQIKIALVTGLNWNYTVHPSLALLGKCILFCNIWHDMLKLMLKVPQIEVRCGCSVAPGSVATRVDISLLVKFHRYANPGCHTICWSEFTCQNGHVNAMQPLWHIITFQDRNIFPEYMAQFRIISLATGYKLSS